MDIDYRHVYQEFEKLRSVRECSEYFSELEEIERLLVTFPLDVLHASQVCSYLTSKYENEINQQSGKLGGKAVVKGASLPSKSPAELCADLQFFKNNIPVFALIREIKSDVFKTLLGI